jgi:hypothetical protein
MNYIINKVQHFVGVDPFFRPSVAEEQFRIPFLLSGDSSDLRFPSVTDASDVDAAQSAFVSSENSVFAAQVHLQILRVRDDPLEIISGTAQNLSKYF